MFDLWRPHYGQTRLLLMGVGVGGLRLDVCWMIFFDNFDNRMQSCLITDNYHLFNRNPTLPYSTLYVHTFTNFLQISVN